MGSTEKEKGEEKEEAEFKKEKEKEKEKKKKAERISSVVPIYQPSCLQGHNESLDSPYPRKLSLPFECCVLVLTCQLEFRNRSCNSVY